MMNRILFIDDDKITLMLFALTVKREKFCKEAETCASALDALDYLQRVYQQKEQVPEVIFLDLNMPVMSGWEFIEAYRSQGFPDYFPNLRIIILTSSVDQHDWIKAEQNKDLVIDFVSKPLSSEYLQHISRTNPYISQYFSNSP